MSPAFNKTAAASNKGHVGTFVDTVSTGGSKV